MTLSSAATEVAIDLDDTVAAPGIAQPADPAGLAELAAATAARIGVGRAGPRPRTAALLRFQADHAVTQDALYRDVDPALLDSLDLFEVQTRVTGGKQEYLLRPDLGRRLSDAARETMADGCAFGADVQVCIGDGLSAAAIEANVAAILPVIERGVRSAGLTFGTPFFIRYCRVGVLNDIGDLLGPSVVVLLIGERPGLGRANSMSAYIAYRPKPGDTDANREVLSNIYQDGGSNPLEAGATIVQMALRMLDDGYSGVRR
jgi:ethanolamine ammonia-lyase small subunit